MCILAERYIKRQVLILYITYTLGADQMVYRRRALQNISLSDLKIMKAIKDGYGYCFLHMCKSGLNMKRYDEDYAAFV